MCFFMKPEFVIFRALTSFYSILPTKKTQTFLLFVTAWKNGSVKAAGKKKFTALEMLFSDNLKCRV